ncbi:thiopurine S-methyltransferase [Sneathiella aquimaris]|uniref:thiopurine S-methyltransferase n=1 Tax=Sneathiella aquimaris TaxID=2599305 RepID=UPI00146D58F1|nr:thiopurine S-methyltransferase [Sneathiella aquimaris]
METEFWHGLWETNNLGFHQEQGNPILAKRFSLLEVAPGNRIFVPLCGKTGDIAWLLGQGYKVVGIELSELAIKQLFSGLSLEPTITKTGPLTLYSAPDIDIFVGDIFELNADNLGTVHGIYDRAALVALPPDMRTRYARHLINITDRAPQFLICYEYDQSLMSGPPFSIDSVHIRDLYANDYSVAPVDRIHVEGGLKGLNDALETVTLLRGKP